MKLRFRNNSLRLRLNRLEVENLAAGGSLEEQVDFPGSSRFSYILEPSQASVSSASFHDGTIRISAPDWQVKDWAKGDAVGLYFQLTGDGYALKIAIEKDLECVDASAEERDPDAFERTGKNC
jgi:hypothetical protein